ncbi:MAG TPA: hypothetical protein PK843_16920, partial [bacterium]|nr:hypothetical protein [bacterium]HPN36191.1 hypothetical protein [bacterium]
MSELSVNISAAVRSVCRRAGQRPFAFSVRRWILPYCHSEPETPDSPQTDPVAKGEESSDALGLGRLFVLFVDRSFGAQSLQTDAAFHCFAPQDDNITGCHSEPETPDSNQTDAVAKGEESSDALGLGRLFV